MRHPKVFNSWGCLTTEQHFCLWRQLYAPSNFQLGRVSSNILRDTLYLLVPNSKELLMQGQVTVVRCQEISSNNKVGPLFSSSNNNCGLVYALPNPYPDRSMA